ncbi:MAG: phosphate/phosphite/phosphonate ABC transporter substrate-binding protein [Candidatus Thiodiazotropha lotti]|nr:phosphate/phosphite/phosphonate ABC transporter substrate-binding protein [Candidatus Thiodiazotropha lotti]ODB99476.1 hypothetical protein A3197_11075 [Candidatus Thiodiazotropha endoloripes]MCG7988063.1 phosphate/phosphite/phosphonate ABC transporter substrate-binding protein [Candidatus Thiodiazotropha lotti]MCG8007317.1 phosphate/phosphite/phosphonate ABC transporter substrate-binding protein [Candidatus Thiodiazotropha lotti]MCW4207414.1 phosphate/phosphite/phosphonate ABC transporter s
MAPASKTVLRRLILLVLTLLLLACQKHTAQSPDPSKPQQPPRPALSLIIHPYDNPSRLLAKFSPLASYLGEQLNLPVELVIARSYIDQIQRISSGQADLAYMGPTPFLRAQDHYLKHSQNKLIPLAAEVKQGRASYHSVIVVREDAPIAELADLSNRTLAFGAPHSFSSHYVPRVMLGNAGLSIEDLRDYAFLGRHERVALSVLHGDFDAGGINEDVARQYNERSPGLRVLSTSPPLPPHLIVARPGLEQKHVIALRSALISPTEDPAGFAQAMQALGGATRFTKPEMSRFQRARRVIATVESTPAELPQW